MILSYLSTLSNKAVNADVFFVRFAHYKFAGYGWRWATEMSLWFVSTLGTKCSRYRLQYTWLGVVAVVSSSALERS